MTRRCFAVLLAVTVVSVTRGENLFSDSFDSPHRMKDGQMVAGVFGEVWRAWPGRDQGVLQASHTHTLSGTNSALAPSHDPVAFSAYADFGATDRSLRAEVYVCETMEFDGSDPAKPVTCMLALFGDAASPDALTDYLELGVVPDASGRSQLYKIRTRYNDLVKHRVINTDVHRQRDQWAKLAIEVDSLENGGEARFYINDEKIGTSYRAGAKAENRLKPVKLRWVRLGNSTKSYENFWYDDVSVRSIPPRKP